MPRLFAPLTATIQNASPQPTEAVPKGAELIQIARDSMVLVVTLNDLFQPFTDLRCRLVHPAAQFCFQTAQLRHHPLSRRFAPYDETSVAPPLPTVVREAEKREGFRLSLSALFPNSFGMFPELDQPRLSVMQFQAELRQPFPKLSEKPFGFRPAFEAHHKIVGVADDNHLAHRHFLAPSFYPQIENVVQVHVGSSGETTAPCGV